MGLRYGLRQDQITLITANLSTVETLNAAIALIKVRRLRFENLELEMACRVGQSAAAGQRQ